MYHTHFVANRGPVPEPNTYSVVGSYGLDQYTRPLYLFVILVLKGIEVRTFLMFLLRNAYVSQNWNTVLTLPNTYLAFAFAFFPLIWSCGLLPSASILIQYVFEQVRQNISLIPENLILNIKIARTLLAGIWTHDKLQRRNVGLDRCSFLFSDCSNTFFKWIQ